MGGIGDAVLHHLAFIERRDLNDDMREFLVRRQRIRQPPLLKRQPLAPQGKIDEELIEHADIGQQHGGGADSVKRGNISKPVQNHSRLFLAGGFTHRGIRQSFCLPFIGRPP